MSARRGRRAVLVAAALLALAAPGAVTAAAPPRADFADVENEIMCDTCNVALNVAESPRADQLRDEIRDLITGGRTKAQIKAQLKAEYGPNILAQPDKSGLGILAYLLPVAVAAGLLALLAVLLPRWRRRASEPAVGPADATSSPAGPSNEDERRLDDELARYGA